MTAEDERLLAWREYNDATDQRNRAQLHLDIANERLDAAARQLVVAEQAARS